MSNTATASPADIGNLVLSHTWRRLPARAFIIALAIVSVFVFFKDNTAPQSADFYDNGFPQNYSPYEPPYESDAVADTVITDNIALISQPPPPPVITVAAPPPPEPWLQYRIRRGDTMEKILRNIKADEAMVQFLVAQKLKSYRLLRVGSNVLFRQNEDFLLTDLLYKTSPEYYLTAGRRSTGELWAEEKAPKLTAVRQTRAGIINSSLFEAADNAQMSDMAIARLIELLEAQIDFYRDVHKGDSFRVIYDEWYDEENEIVQMGSIYAVEYNRQERGDAIVAAHHPDGGYYNPDGYSLQKAFLAAPLKYRRISSRFTNRRFHPVLKKWRPHRGVDYAAPRGTPVRATADGVITKIAKERGYGNVVFIKHFNIYTTVYGHLRNFAKGIRRNKKVTQGQIIGYVGSTGLSTGPHLHYEFRVRGKHKDPLRYDIPRQLPPLKDQALEQFRAHSEPLFAQLKSIPL